jgi:hypothetical protein
VDKKLEIPHLNDVRMFGRRVGLRIFFVTENKSTEVRRLIPESVERKR